MIPELLAPAGTPATLHAAIRAGADAVYLGVGTFNARRNAENFTYETLAQGCAYAHLRGRKIYITLNTVILPHEMPAALECARQCWEAGADAFIVQDIGLAVQIKRILPDCRLHISTQMNIHNESGIEACADLGAARVTLARELSLGEIQHLCEVAKSCHVEIETFAHGALCICYSGQCLMSSMIGGRSANRGLCAQACRLPYELREVDVVPRHAHERYSHASHESEATYRRVGEQGPHLLSPKDLCTLDILDELVDAGVSSLKIEGRMKSPEYVAMAVKVYREALDTIAEEKQEFFHKRDDMHRHLESVFSRGFTTAYMEGVRDRSMMSYQRPNNRGQFVGRIKEIDDGACTLSSDIELVAGDLLEIWSRRGNARVEIGKVDVTKKNVCTITPTAATSRELTHACIGDRVFRIKSAQAAYKDSDLEPRIEITAKVTLALGEPLRMECYPASDPSVYVSVEGPEIEQARTKALTEQEVEEHIDRLGSTPFYLGALDVQLDPDVGLGFSQLHKVRAHALELLEQKMLERNGSKKRSNAASTESVSVKVSPSVNNRNACDGAQNAADANQTIDIAALATNPECARAAKRAGATTLYVPALNYRRGQAQLGGVCKKDASQASFPKHCTIMMPAINHDAEGLSREALLGGDVWEYAAPDEPLYVESLSALYTAASLGALPEVGPGLPITNDSSVNVAAAFGAHRIWLSPELNLRQIEELISGARPASDITFGIKIVGAQELMVCEHCLLMSDGECAQQCTSCPRRQKRYVLHDRKDYDFPLSVDLYGRTHLFNGVMLDCLSALPELLDAGVTAYMVDTTLMNAEETAQAVGRIVSALKDARSGKAPAPKLPHTTAGHLFRGVK